MIKVMSLTVRGSGRKIIDILRRNPEKNPESYEEEDIAHMRKVASYCKVRNVFRINYSVRFVFKGLAFIFERRCRPCAFLRHGSIHKGIYMAKLEQTFPDSMRKAAQLLRLSGQSQKRSYDILNLMMGSLLVQAQGEQKFDPARCFLMTGTPRWCCLSFAVTEYVY